jgi:hypothetical protein
VFGGILPRQKIGDTSNLSLTYNNIYVTGWATRFAIFAVQRKESFELTGVIGNILYSRMCVCDSHITDKITPHRSVLLVYQSFLCRMISDTSSYLGRLMLDLFANLMGIDCCGTEHRLECPELLQIHRKYRRYIFNNVWSAAVPYLVSPRD